jgi:outer membrane immunogenic protein
MKKIINTLSEMISPPSQRSERVGRPVHQSGLVMGVALVTAMIAGNSSAGEPAYEIPPPVVERGWSGLYGGVFGGYGSGDADILFNTKNENGDFWNLDQDIEGELFGGRIGYDFQSGNFVFGLYADIAYANIDGDRSNPGGPPVGFKTEIDTIATLQGRIGILLNNNRTLLYLHGGGALADVTLSGSGGPANDFNSQSDWRAGLVGGIGIEHMLTNNLSIYAEYSYMNFLESDRFLISDGSDYKGAVDGGESDLHTILLGVNMRFGPGITSPSAAPVSSKGALPVYGNDNTWGGLYAGFFGGYGSGDADVTFNSKNENGHFWDMDHDIEDELFGGRIGYDFQSGNLVYGFYADIALADINGDSTNPQNGSNFVGIGGSEDGPPVKFKTEIDTIATLQARVGTLLNNEKTLLYLHGGGAFADVTLSGSGGPANDFSSESEWKAGLVGGVGLEHMLTDDVSIFAEYSYMHFLGSDLFQIRDSGDYKGAVRGEDRDLHTILLGVNIRFN